MSTLTDKQNRFISEYLVDLNATQAAIRAGYAVKSANREGARLLSNADIAREVAERQGKIHEKLELTAERVLREMAALAFCDVRGFYDESGKPKALSALTAEQGAALQGAEVILKNAEAGDGVIDKVHKIRLWDKTRALEMLAKYFGLLTEKVEHSGDLSFRWLTPEEKQ